MIKRLMTALILLAILIETGDAVILIGESESIREVKAVRG